MTNTLSAYEQQYRSAKDIRSRLMGKPPVRVTKLELVHVAEPEKSAPRPSWEISPTDFDCHVTVWRSLIEKTAQVLSENEALRGMIDDHELEIISSPKRKVREIVQDVLNNYPDITWDEIISPRRNRALIPPRHECMRAVFKERPDMSFPQIGRIFRRDHTSVMWAVGKIRKPPKHYRSGENSCDA